MKKIILPILLVILISSCEEAPQRTADGIKAYMDFAPGSYWVYNQYSVTEDGQEILKNTRDSVYVAGDTTIGKHVFRVIKGTTLNSTFTTIRRDSGDFELSPSNRITMSIDPGHHSYDTSHVAPVNETFFYHTFLYDDNSSVVVPAGKFNSIELTQEVKTESAELKPCRFHYAKGVGLVRKEVSTYPNKAEYVLKLVRYKIVD